LTLLRPEPGIRNHGRRNGTLPGNDAAFVTAVAVLEKYWAGRSFEHTVQ